MNRVGIATRDTLSDTLSALQVRATVFCLSELSAPWGFTVDAAPIAKFHLVLTGAATLAVEGRDPIQLGAGDVVILPHGQAHAIRSDIDAVAPPLDELIDEHPLVHGVLRYGGECGADTRLLCGGFTVAEPSGTGVLAMVPDVIWVEGRAITATTWLAPLLAALESRRASHGLAATQAKVAEVFLTEALRSWLLSAQGSDGFPLATMASDPVVASAGRRVHANLAARWSIAQLADEACVSRTAFVTRFRDAVGEAPMRYLARVRLGTAAGLLATTELTLDEVATRVGYQDRASLSKAFTREFGVAPGGYRSTARRGDIRVTAG